MAQRGGNIAGVAREQAEKELGGSVVSPEIFYRIPISRMIL